MIKTVLEKNKVLLVLIYILFLFCPQINSQSIIDKLPHLFSVDNNKYKIDYTLQKSPTVRIQDIVNLKINELNRLGKNFKSVLSKTFLNRSKRFKTILFWTDYFPFSKLPLSILFGK